MKTKYSNEKTIRAIRSNNRITKFYEDLENEGNLLFSFTYYLFFLFLKNNFFFKK